MVKPSEQDVFDQALKFEDPNERAQFLAQSCHGDESMRRRVEALVAAYLSSEYLEPSAEGITDLERTWHDASLVGTTVGSYSVLELIGEGGIGDVYLARRSEGDPAHVALKVIKPGMDSRQVMARFDLERVSLARMDHPHIAKFIEAGVSDRGQAYFVMELVSGLSITEYCDRNRLNVDRRLRLIIDVCLAVEHAHTKGLIHRDLKPSNILVTEVNGTPFVKIIDFGVAKALDHELNDRTIFTHPSQFIGTPIYMSPEQMRWCPDVDVRSDVYSTGVVMYELLSGSPPIDQSILRTVGLEELRRIIQEDDTIAPSKQIASLPASVQGALAASRGVRAKQLQLQLRGDLDWIVLTALAKDRSMRYATAAELADDINRHLTHQVVRAHPPHLSTRIRKWSRRNPQFLRAAALSATMLVAAFATYWFIRSDGATANSSDAAASHLAYCKDVQQAWFRVMSGDRPGALSLLDKYSPDSSGRSEVGFEWHMIHDLAADMPLRVFQGASSAVLSADISAGRRWVAIGESSGAVKIWDASTAQLAHSLQIDGGEATVVKFSPDGKWLAWAGMDRTVHLTETGKWTDEVRLQKHTATVACVAWSPDSKYLASAGRDHNVFIWDVENARHLRSLPGHVDAVRCVAWSPDGNYLATSNGTQGVILWDTDDWKQLYALNSGGTGTLCISFSPDSRWVAFGGYHRVLSVAVVDDPKTLMHITSREQIWSLEYLSDFRILAGLGNGQVQLFRVVYKRPPHKSRLTSEWVTIGKGGDYRRIGAVGDEEAFLVAREEDRAVELVAAVDLLGYRPPLLDTFVSGAAGDYVLTTDKVSNATHVRNVHRGDAVRLDIAVFYSCPPAYSTATKQFAVAENGRSICFFDARSWSLQRRVTISPPPRTMSFSKDGRFLAVGCEQGQLRIIDTLRGSVQSIPSPSHQYHCLAQFSPVDDVLAVAGILTTTVRLLRGSDMEQISSFETGSEIRCLEYSPDGNRLVVAESQGVSLWEIPTARPVGFYGHHTEPPVNLKFSPNGRTIASIDEHNLHIWDAGTTLRFCTIPIWQCPTPWLAFIDDDVLLTGDIMTGIYHSFGGRWACDNRLRSPSAITLPRTSSAN